MIEDDVEEPKRAPARRIKFAFALLMAAILAYAFVLLKLD